MKKDLLSLLDFEPEDFEYLFVRAMELKKRHKEGIMDSPLAGKSVGLLFNKKSTRTRISFETAAVQLGGHPIYMSASDTQLSRNEPAKDTARVLSRYLDCLVIRTYDQATMEEFAQYASIPVINALTDSFHPCQILSDLMTVIETKGGYKDVNIAWVGDGNNMANSWVNAAARLGFQLTLACPRGFEVSADILEQAGVKEMPNIRFTTDPVEAVTNADVVNTDVWASMGEEDQLAKRIAAFQGFEVNAKLLAHAKPDVTVLHCLPAHRGEEISEEILEHPQSAVWDQAENKRHMHKALLETLICGKQS